MSGLTNSARVLLRAALSRADSDFRDGLWACIDALSQLRWQLVVGRSGRGMSMDASRPRTSCGRFLRGRLAVAGPCTTCRAMGANRDST